MDQFSLLNILKNLKKNHLHIQIKYLLVVPFTLGHLRLDADTKTILKTPACDFHGTVDQKNFINFFTIFFSKIIYTFSLLT